ncbi:MAG: hypothetical protein J6X63_07205 [Bacteroidales bacterium]|nr:hypothetical protein [Bacteroidales bacterium]
MVNLFQDASGSTVVRYTPFWQQGLSASGVGKVEFYTGDLPRRIWLESDFWGRSQDYFSTFPTVATGGRKVGHCTEPTGTPGR